MKKSILTFGFLLFTVATAHSATVVSGSLDNATWDKTGSPYEVQGAAAIPAGVTVNAGPGVLVVFAPGASLEVRGTLKVNGAAAFPTQFRIPQGGGYLLVKGGELSAMDAKFVGGYFVVEDGKVEVVACEITGGSGPYLRGTTTAVFRSNKIYGNSCGFTLDGDQVRAEFIFNTLVMNTYGLHLKKYSMLTLENNSIHDNAQFQVVNDLYTPAVLGNNFWGTDQAAAVPVRGAARLDPMKSMKEVLREYVMTQLPNLPQKKMAQVVKNAKAEKAAARVSAKKAEVLRKSQAVADAKKEKAKLLADKRAAKRKELAEKKAAEKVALEAKIKEVAPAETPAAVAPVAEPVQAEVAAPAVAPSVEPQANSAAPAGEIPALIAPPTVETSLPQVPPEATVPNVSPDVAAPAAPAVVDNTVGALAPPSTESPDIPGLIAPPSSPDVAAPAVANVTTSAAPASSAASTVVAPASEVPVTAAPVAGAPAIPAGIDSSNANMVPAPVATVGTSAAPADFSGLDLPPLDDKPIQAPKDMDLPPVDDLK